MLMASWAKGPLSILILHVIMSLTFRFAVLFLVAVSAVVNVKVLAQSYVVDSFESNDIIPDLITEAPKYEAIVIYPNGVRVNRGNELTPTQVKDIPTVLYIAAPDCFYTLAFVDPDAPSRAEPVLREWNHWLVVNIPGNYVVLGETLAEYIGSAPPSGTGLHRYVFLVYQQPDLLTFDEPRLNNTSAYNRDKFSITNFAKNTDLVTPSLETSIKHNMMTMYQYSMHN